MQKKHVEVTVKGYTGFGKSTVMQIIADALESKGILVSFPEEKVSKSFQNKRIETLKSLGLEVTLEVVQSF